ncbi:MAG: thioredoxin-dependent thiol peroxidase [Pedosphaera sp.]|nr:thioredoxin-dependent thiol peroxidase [Pedosphaera sp.]
MTTANKITVLRILLVPFFVVQMIYYIRSGDELNRWIAFSAFAVASVCDGIDGYIARRYNQRTELGAFLDPLADKLLLVSALVLLSLGNTPFNQLPLWLVGTVLGRDALLAIGSIAIYYANDKVRVKPHIIGKVSTVLQMLCVGWVLLKWDGAMLHYLALGSALTVSISGLIYLADGFSQIGTSPAALPQIAEQGKLPFELERPSLLGAALVMAMRPNIQLIEGDLAPDFSAETNGGGRVALSDFIGKNVALFFYPKDDTPGCAKEVCGFRNAHDEFVKRGVIALGISIDSVKSHDRFAAKHTLPFKLIADEDRKIAQAYGTWGRKKFMGREYDGVHRVTFLIGPDGRIRKIWAKVKPAIHAQEVLAAI